MKETVVVGMSGGVDSSVAAYLLKKQGYQVIGVTMQIWQDELVAPEDENPEGCCGLSAVEDARCVAEKLEIPYYVMNFREIFRKTVIDNFVSEYKCGHTPNPCIMCNRYVKWEALLDKAMALGADYIATGHYANIIRLDNGRYAVANAKTAKKDQTYALYNLTQHQLAHTLMPLGEYEKEEIRQIAEEIGLEVAHKPDSQDICFVPDGDYQKFILSYTGEVIPQGNFVDADGHILGKHQGITRYTIGQRKGLGLAFGKPAFVTAIRADQNEVVIGSNEELFHTHVTANTVNMMAADTLTELVRAKAKVRYAHSPADCTVSIDGNGILHCEFDEPQRAITPGQALVIYQKKAILCGGVILS